ncbi:MAG: translocation/assembly module TamB domain-containing protein [Pseudomonadota bacterium]|nr:translocation/assembly module TamB domain-containing protein [Pseudomonadota bacterium]
MRRVRRIIRWLALGLAGLAVLLVGTVFWFLNLAGEGVWTGVLHLALDSASTPGEMEFAASRFRRDDDGVIRLGHFAIADADGTWLSLDELEIDLELADLFGGALTVNRLAAARIEVAREPLAGPDTEPEPESADGPLLESFAWPRAPLPVRLGDLSIRQVVLGPGLVPEPLTFSVAGALADHDTTQRLRLDLVPDVPGGGEIRADLGVDFAGRASRIAVRADLPVLTPMAEALQIAGTNRIHLNVNGGGPFGGARIDVDAGVQSVADLAATLNLRADPATGWTVGLDALVNAIAGGPVPVEITGQTIALHLQASGPDETRATLDALGLDLDGISLVASGHYDLAADDLALQLDGRVAPDAPALALAEGVGFDAARITGSLKGGIDDLQAELAARVDGLAAPGAGAGSVDLGVISRIRGETISGRLDLVLDGPSLGDPGLDALVGARPTLGTRFEVLPDRVTLTEIALQAAALTLTGTAATTLPEPALDADLLLSVPDLSTVADLRSVVRAGGGQVEIRAQALTPDDGGRLTLAGRFADLAFVEPAVRGLVGNAMTLNAELSPRNGGGAVLARLSTAAGPDLMADLSISADGGATGTYRVNLPKLPAGLLPPDIAATGPLQLDGSLSGSAEAPATKGRLRLPKVVVAGIEIAGATLGYDVTNLAEAPAGRLDLGARLNGADLLLGSRFALTEDFDRLQVSETRLTLAGARLDASADARLSAATYRAQAELDLPQAGPLAGLFGVPVDGAVTANVDLAPAGRAHDATLRLTISNLAAADAVQVAGVDLDVTLSDVTGGSPGLGGSLTIADVVADGATIDSIVARLGGTAMAPTVEIDSRASVPVEARVTLAASADLENPDGPAVTVSRVDFAGLGQTAATTAPFTLIAGETLTLEGLRIGSSLGATLAADASYGPDAIRSDISLAGVHLERVGQIAGIVGLGGVVDAIIRVDTDAPDRVRAEVRAAGVTLPDVPRDKTFDLGANLSWDGSNAGGRLVLSGPFSQPLEAGFTAALPTGPDGLLPEPQDDAPLGASVDWAGELSEVMALLPEGDHLLSGAARIAVAATGTVGSPVIQGTVAVDNGRYENLLTGTILQSIGLKAGFDQDGTGTVDLSATDLSGGTVNGGGSVRTGGDNPGGTVRIDMANLHAVLRDEARVVLSGQTTVDWDGKLVSVTNRTTVNDAELRLIEDVLPPDVVAIDLADDTEKPAEEVAAEPKDDLPVKLDVVVDIPGRFFVRGRGLESEWGGRVSVTGMLPSPAVDADLKVLRGQLSLLGKDFTVSRGTIALAGGRPLFDIRLERETADLTGIIAIAGSASAPKLTFSSVPELPSDEVLPRLFFDKSAQSLSAVEAVQLAQGLRTLSSGDRGITDRIRDTVGLDVLRVEEGSTPDSTGAVSVGRYVRDGVYVGAKQSLDSDEGGVVVEIDLLPNLKVDAEVGRTGQGSTGITWERRY